MVKPAMRNFLLADIYGITAEQYSLGRSNIEVVQAMIDAGIKVIQYREKDKSAREMYNECTKIMEMARKAGVTFIVNDRVDLAMMVNAHGVHVGQDDLPVKEVRRLMGEEAIVGLSTHLPEQARAAALSGAVDYIGVGPLFATYTKKDVCEAVGLEYLDFVVQNINLPFVAIGGIKDHNIAEVRRRGARTIALVTDIVGAQDIPAKVRKLRAIMREQAEPC